MSGICGWVGAEPTNDAPEVSARMAAALAGASAGTVRTHARSGGAVGAAGERPPATLHEQGRWLIAVHGRPRGPGDVPLDTRWLCERYEARGPDAFAEVQGTFAVVMVDPGHGDAVLAVDRHGIQTLVYAAIPGGIACASGVDALRLHPRVDLRVSSQGLYNYLYFHVVPGPETVFTGVERVAPGECVVVRGGNAARHGYWRMRYSEDAEGPFETLRGEFREAIRTGVRRCLQDRPVGAFLSGGTDSSTVAGMLGEVTGRPARTFSIGFAEAGYDETEYARTAVRHFGTEHREYYVTPDDIVEAIPQVAKEYDQPFGNSSVVPTYCCARLARSEGIELLLAGDGGDELFGGNERYATQSRFERWQRIPAWLRAGALEPLGRAIPAGLRVPGLRHYRRLVELCTLSTPDRMMAYNLLERLGTARLLTPEFLAQVDATVPLAYVRQPYDQADAHSSLNRMMAMDLKITLADNDFPKVTGACTMAGVEVGFPMMDEAVVDFSGRLAPHLKVRGNRLRHFFKEALRGFLPDEIISKQKHGFGLPFGPWLRTHGPLQALVGDTLADLRTRRIVEPALLDELTGARLAEHAGYYGAMVWVLVMLEQWFKARPWATPA